MTIRETMLSLLVENGLWEDEAASIMSVVEADKASESMAGRWTDRMEDYPPQMKSVLWLGVRSTALDWLKANKPRHWALPMFDPSDPIHSSTNLERKLP